MAESFTKSNPQLEREIAGARSTEELRDILLAYQQSQGLPTKFDRVALPGSAGTSSSQPTASVESSGRTPQYFEVLYPSGNDRIEISAATQEEFDRRKAAVLAAYGKK